MLNGGSGDRRVMQNTPNWWRCLLKNMREEYVEYTVLVLRWLQLIRWPLATKHLGLVLVGHCVEDSSCLSTFHCRIIRPTMGAKP